MIKQIKFFFLMRKLKKFLKKSLTEQINKGLLYKDSDENGFWTMPKIEVKL